MISFIKDFVRGIKENRKELVGLTGALTAILVIYGAFAYVMYRIEKKRAEKTFEVTFKNDPVVSEELKDMIKKAPVVKMEDLEQICD